MFVTCTQRSRQISIAVVNLAICWVLVALCADFLCKHRLGRDEQTQPFPWTIQATRLKSWLFCDICQSPGDLCVVFPKCGTTALPGSWYAGQKAIPYTLVVKRTLLLSAYSLLSAYKLPAFIILSAHSYRVINIKYIYIHLEWTWRCWDGYRRGDG